MLWSVQTLTRLPSLNPGGTAFAYHSLRVIAPVSSLTHSLTHPFAERGVLGVFATLYKLQTRPMIVTALGPACRSAMSTSVYSLGGCQGPEGAGCRAACNSSCVKPSPIVGLLLLGVPVGFVGEVLLLVVGGKEDGIAAWPLPAIVTAETR